MAKSEIAFSVDEIQRRLRAVLAELGFKRHGRAFNRRKPDCLVDVIHFQMGAFEPPGSQPIPGLRESLYGKFAINLGVYVPEVAAWQTGRQATSAVQDYHCCIRRQLGASPDTDRWWPIRIDECLIGEIATLVERDAVPFFAKYGSRDQILSVLGGASANTHEVSVPRIISAIIFAERGEFESAKELLRAQAYEAQHSHPHHATYVRQLAARMGLALQ